MQLYAGMSSDFSREVTRNQIAELLKTAFTRYYRFEPAPGEVTSWRNSLRAMKDVLELGSLTDHGVLLEYQLPLMSKRIDCIVCGRDSRATDQAVLVELKQWDKCGPAEPDKLVTTWVGGAIRPVLHPSVQAAQYRDYLVDSHEEFHRGERTIGLGACTYLHNYKVTGDDPLIDPKFDDARRIAPIFDLDDAEALAQHLHQQMLHGDGDPVLRRIQSGRPRPSKKLMDHVAFAIRNHSPWVLIDEQLVAFESILALARRSASPDRKQAVIVRGGPGTGKSVLAINVIAQLAQEGIGAVHATGSKALTETLWRILGSGTKPVFRYFNSFGGAPPNSIEVLICDEAHRIRETSASRFTPKAKRSTKPQAAELIDAARVAVFFIDDRQGVRPNEIGSTAHIRECAKQADAEVAEFDLAAQFRCAGSDGFVNWIDNTLGIRRTANVLWDGSDGFDFRVFDSPESLEHAIREQAQADASARMAAGFCWRWSPPRADGTLVDDVIIGQYRRPWDAKPGNYKLAPGIPSAALWATDPAGIDQIGCVYNIQGFELDYIGVIWGKDLRYDWEKRGWIGDKSESADAVVKRAASGFTELVKNTYRVLLSRGMRGCYVHFLDRDTERFVRSRLESTDDVSDS